MNAKTASILLASSLLLAASGVTKAEVPLKSKAYQCAELKQLVVEKERVYLQGFLGSKSVVYSSASSCNYFHEIPKSSAWRTKDVFSCVVGYRCLSRVFQESFFGRGH